MPTRAKTDGSVIESDQAGAMKDYFKLCPGLAPGHIRVSDHWFVTDQGEDWLWVQYDIQIGKFVHYRPMRGMTSR